MKLACGTRTLDLRAPVVMGILNITTDSFSDGGELLAGDRLDCDALLARAEAMVAAGAAVLDVGGESTRPGAEAVAEAEEAERIGEALALLAPRFDVVLSVDSSSPLVMGVAADAGAGMLNDVRALRRQGALEAAAASGIPVCLMHMQGDPQTMQVDPRYDDVIREVRAFLAERMAACVAAGIAPEQLLVDPGFGFGKRLTHNVTILRELRQIANLGPPVIVGMSRKRMLGDLTGRTVTERVASGVAAAALAVERGARIVRTHDVAPTVDALAVALAVRES